MPTCPDTQPAPNADDATTLPAGSSALPSDQAPPDLMVFKSRERLRQDSARPTPRYTRRLSDLIATSFYEACRIGNLDVALQLMEALEREVMRSIRVAGVEERYDGDDLAAVQLRYAQEVRKRRLERAGSGLSASD